MRITPHLFEAFVRCPTKCWLRAASEVPAGNAYAQWSASRTDVYRAEGIERLIAERREDECAISPVAEKLKMAAWQLAVDVAVQATNLETRIAAVERVPSGNRGKAAQFAPIRFAWPNKLGRHEKLLLAFDALALSAWLTATTTRWITWVTASDQATPSEALVVAALNRFEWLVGHLSREKQRELLNLFLRKIEVHRDIRADKTGRALRLVLFMDPANLLAATGEVKVLHGSREPRRRVLGKEHRSSGTPIEVGLLFTNGKDRSAVEIIYPFRVTELRRLNNECTLSPKKESDDQIHPVVRALEWQLQLQQDRSMRPADIARATKRSRASVSQHLKLLKLDPEILAHFRKEPLPAAVRVVSLRKLLALVKMTPAQQCRKFQSLIGRPRSRSTSAAA